MLYADLGMLGYAFTIQSLEVERPQEIGVETNEMLSVSVRAVLREASIWKDMAMG